jgi:hypothetical protein
MKATCCLLISLTIFCSCKKSSGPIPLQSNATVYVCASCYDSLMAHVTAGYWEDTVVHYLSGASGATSKAQAIAWSNNELYVAGQASEWIPAAGLWVNGIPKDLGLGDTAALSNISGMYVSGNDIYLAGYGVNGWADYGNGNGYAKIWKNGVITTLINNPGFSQAMGVTVAGQDVYVAWTEAKQSGYNIAGYNKNENRFILDSTSYGVYCQAICSSGSDVYIAGNLQDSLLNQNLGVYWKNGSMIKILPTANEVGTVATGITVIDNDVYISGGTGFSNKTYAVYWKNGIEYRLTDGTFQAVALAIAVSGADVYVAGIENQMPVYWKNNVPHKLPLPKMQSCYPVTGMVVVQK